MTLDIFPSCYFIVFNFLSPPPPTRPYANLWGGNNTNDVWRDETTLKSTHLLLKYTSTKWETWLLRELFSYKDNWRIIITWLVRFVWWHVSKISIISTINFETYTVWSFETLKSIMPITSAFNVYLEKFKVTKRRTHQELWLDRYFTIFYWTCPSSETGLYFKYSEVGSHTKRKRT
jgi:hypothetical protein